MKAPTRTAFALSRGASCQFTLRPPGCFFISTFLGTNPTQASSLIALNRIHHVLQDALIAYCCSISLAWRRTGPPRRIAPPARFASLILFRQQRVKRHDPSHSVNQFLVCLRAYPRDEKRREQAIWTRKPLPSGQPGLSGPPFNSSRLNNLR